MSVTTNISKEGKVKTTYDENNPRIYSVEYRCTKCGAWIDSEDLDLVWINPKTGETAEAEGDPYCGDCSPLNDAGGSNKFGGDTGVDADFDLDVYGNKDINEG